MSQTDSKSEGFSIPELLIALAIGLTEPPSADAVTAWKNQNTPARSDIAAAEFARDFAILIP